MNRPSGWQRDGKQTTKHTASRKISAKDPGKSRKGRHRRKS